MIANARYSIWRKPAALYVFAVLVNIILSFAVLGYRQPFNVDGILYLNAATAYLQQGWHAAASVYTWPFYSILLAKLSQITTLSMVTIAWYLNALFSSILVLFFLLFIKECGGTIREQYWGFILLILYPYLFHDRYNILRDFGYYGFFIVSLWFFARFLRLKQWRYSAGWQCSLWLATLFRIEGVALLLFIPFTVFFMRAWSIRQKIFAFFKLQFLNILIGLTAIIFIHEFAHFGRIPELLRDLQLQPILSNWHNKTSIIRSQILSEFGDIPPSVFLSGGLVTFFIAVLINTLGIFYCILSLCAVAFREVRFAPQTRVALWSYGCITLLVLMAFLAQQFFLSGRYVVPLCLLLMFPATFALNTLWNKQLPSLKIGLMLLLIVTAISSVGHFGTSKTYVIDAGNWIAQHTPVKALVYSNDAQLEYYSQRGGRTYPQDFQDRDWWSALQQAPLDHYNYAAIMLRHAEHMPTEQELLQFFKQPPLQIFRNNRGDKIYIFQIATGADMAG